MSVQDAAGLAKLSASVEEVFASGDLPRAAETLANMRRCLAVVGEVRNVSIWLFFVFQSSLSWGGQSPDVRPYQTV